jgi:hypothetical protein
MSKAIGLAIFLLAGAPEPAAPAASGDEARPLVTMFLYAKARYYHDASIFRRCDKVDNAQARALKRRFDRAFERLVARHGTLFRDFPRTAPADQGSDPDCAMRVTLFGFGRAMDDLEAQMKKEGVP